MFVLIVELYHLLFGWRGFELERSRCLSNVIFCLLAIRTGPISIHPLGISQSYCVDPRAMAFWIETGLGFIQAIITLNIACPERTSYESHIASSFISRRSHREPESAYNLQRESIYTLLEQLSSTVSRLLLSWPFCLRFSPCSNLDETFRAKPFIPGRVEMPSIFFDRLPLDPLFTPVHCASCQAPNAAGVVADNPPETEKTDFDGHTPPPH